MSTSKLSAEIDWQEINRHRRRFCATTTMTLAAAQLGMIGAANAQSATTTPARVPAIKPGTNASFAPLKHIDAGLLNVGYAEAGPAAGPPVILLHGWPYDIYSFVDVAPLLASAGYRVVIPYLRGYGTTRFISSETFRNGQPSVVAVDMIALMDALALSIWSRAPMPRNSRATIRTGPSRAASATISPKKPRRLSPKPSSMWIRIDSAVE